ncbi:MAG: cytochrome c class [Thermoleophilia bacterium]|nr:cytochrome c class [Thermoleophilia bacterium]
MRFSKLLTVIVVASAALVASGCGGGPKDAGSQLSAACKRQIEEIADAKSQSKIVTAKSSEATQDAEQLHECAGQEPIVAASTRETDPSASDDGSSSDMSAKSDETASSGGDTASSNMRASASDDNAKPDTAAALDPAARTLFASTCGSCHTLADAKTSGTVGPDLDTVDDDAKQIEDQILHGGGGMPPKLLTGDDATKVAGYVAAAGKDS